MKIEDFINKENNIFYIDLGDYNTTHPDLVLEEGDMIRFNYDNERYTGTIVNYGSAKTGIYQIDLKKK